MSRAVYLLVIHSNPFPAYWALWIPSLVDPKLGKLINVRGDSMTGFSHEFERRHALGNTVGTYSTILAGKVDESHILDEIETESKGNFAIDLLEEKALLVPAPEKSRRSTRTSALGVRTRVVLKNCQTWMADYIELLVTQGIVPAEALGVVKNAPRN